MVVVERHGTAAKCLTEFLDAFLGLGHPALLTSDTVSPRDRIGH